MCVCSLRYPACNAHAPYWHLRPAPLYNVFFSHDLINGTIFEKKLLNTKYVFRFSLQFLWETFCILRRTERDMIQNVYWSSCKCPWFLSDFIKTCIFSIFFFENCWNIKFHGHPLVGAELFHAERRTDGQIWWIWNKNQLMSLFQFYLYIAGSLHVSGPQAHPQESSHSSSHNHWFLVIQ